MQSPQVSVLLATYRPVYDWLREAIDSVRAQTFSDFELLILDDDRSAGVHRTADSFSDRRIRYLPGPRRGPAYNHLFGIQEARASLVSIINHDDFWEPLLLERLLEAYRAVPDAVLAFADHWVMDEAGVIDPDRSNLASEYWKRASLSSGVHQPFDRVALVHHSVALAQAAVFARDIAAQLDPRSGRWYDWHLTYLLARTGRPAVYVPERLAAWRASREGLTANRSLAGAVAYVRVSWQMYRDPALKDLRRPLAGELVSGVRLLLASFADLARKGTRSHNTAR
jgi:glycosyltransferase involved in cell wall biosynthesis